MMYELLELTVILIGYTEYITSNFSHAYSIRYVCFSYQDFLDVTCQHIVVNTCEFFFIELSKMSSEEIDEFAEVAHGVVDTVIEKAIKRLKQETLQRQKTLESIRFDLSRDNTVVYPASQYEDYDIKNIDWLTIGEFTIEAAESKLHEFIKVCMHKPCFLLHMCIIVACYLDLITIIALQLKP